MKYDVILTDADSIVSCWVSGVSTLRFNNLSLEEAEMLVRLSSKCEYDIRAALLPVAESEEEGDA